MTITGKDLIDWGFKDPYGSLMAGNWRRGKDDRS